MIRIEKILCPVDFFPSSERAVDYAIALGNNYAARLVLLHVVSPVVPMSYEIPLNTGEITASLIEAAKAQLKIIARRAEAKKIPVQCLVRVGDVDLEIRDAVKEERVDLVVMGSHGRRNFEKWFLGSHTERLLRRARVPLIVIGGKAAAKSAPPLVRNIMVLTDFSEGTHDAMRYAFSIGQECQAKITLMHVLNDIDASISGRYRDPLIKSIRLELESLIPREAGAWCDVNVRVETGLPYRRILKVLREDKFDLLVMNIHGKSMLDRALLGSTAERVMRGAGMPIMLIPRLVAAKGKKRAVRKAA
jgi:nucleotide-binding universal stress UspA family protein